MARGKNAGKSTKKSKTRKQTFRINKEHLRRVFEVGIVVHSWSWHYCYSSLLTTILSSNSLYKNSQNNNTPLSEDEVRDIKDEQIDRQG